MLSVVEGEIYDIDDWFFIVNDETFLTSFSKTSILFFDILRINVINIIIIIITTIIRIILKFENKMSLYVITIGLNVINSFVFLFLIKILT